MSTFVTRWEPFRDLQGLQERVNRLFRETGNGNQESFTSGSFVPPVDIYEDEHSITVRMEVPGVNQNEIDIRLENNVLTVKGERKFEKDEKEENFHRVERRYGTFFRSFTVPNSVDTEGVTADYENGVLGIKLAKRAEAKPKQVKINVGSAKTIDAKKSVGQVA